MLTSNIAITALIVYGIFLLTHLYQTLDKKLRERIELLIFSITTLSLIAFQQFYFFLGASLIMGIYNEFKDTKKAKKHGIYIKISTKIHGIILFFVAMLTVYTIFNLLNKLSF